MKILYVTCAVALGLSISTSALAAGTGSSPKSKSNAQLALKQKLINGTCPDGSAVQQVLSDGSVVCQGVSGTSGQLEKIAVYHLF